jgi:hypothetical protein
VARDEDAEAIAGAEASGSPSRPGSTRERRELAVGDDLAPRHRQERRRKRGAERRLELEIELDARERHVLAAEKRLQKSHDRICHRIGTDT